MMNSKIVSLILTFVIIKLAAAQPTFVSIDPEKSYKEAKEYFAQEQYGLAYPILNELVNNNVKSNSPNLQYLQDDVNYFYDVCLLKLHLPIAEDEAKKYINTTANDARVQMLSYELGKYYFLKENFTEALNYYTNAGIANLTNQQIADSKFEKAYCYFNLKQFENAKPLFNEIHQLDDNKYFYPANYYYGFICYYNRDFKEAQNSFLLVATQPEYENVVPYYITEIYYFQGRKDDALRYGESVLKKGNQLYYQNDLNLLVGQLYFEKKNFEKALPLIESYVNKSDKVSKEIMYELSYCYYNDKQIDKAITGFKQLSNERDSMGQNSMYLLGDCYLQKNDKNNARSAFQYCAYNSSNKLQQQISRFNYAKLSYELGYQDIALNEMKNYLMDYPKSNYDSEAKEILVALLANSNNFKDALSIYENMDKPTASMQKLYPKILYGRAVELFNEQQINEADVLFDKVLQLPTTNVTPYTNYWKGEIAYRNKNYDNSIKYYNIFLQANTSSQGEASIINAKYNLAYSWFQKENFKQALTYFEQISGSLSSTSTNVQQDAFVRAADCYYMSKDYVKANNMYDMVLNNALQQSDYALYQKAMIAGIKNSTVKIQLLNKISTQYPQSNLINEANMEMADTYIADEKFTEAINSLHKILTSNTALGMKPKTLLKLGLCYYNLDKNNEALNYYEQLIQQYPQSDEADDALGIIKNIYVEEGKPNDYVELMRKNGKIISISEADSITYVSAEMKYNTNNCTAAIEGFNNYLTQYPAGAYALEANYFRSECYYKNKDWQNALIGYDYVNSKGINKYFEKATLQAAQINYFELKNYVDAKKYFESLNSNAANQENQIEALRGLVRCYYQLKDYTLANNNAKILLTKKGLSTDDKAITWLVLGKSQQVNNDCSSAISSFKSCASINKSNWGAEARYEIANCEYMANNLAAAEKSAMAVIKQTGSYDYWLTKSYILLGDIYVKQKDYFNAKAAYEGVAKNAAIIELKNEAQQKLDAAIAEEKLNSKVN